MSDDLTNHESPASADRPTHGYPTTDPEFDGAFEPFAARNADRRLTKTWERAKAAVAALDFWPWSEEVSA